MMASSWLVAPGSQQMWWCPDCGRLLNRPPKVIDGDRFHSWKCRHPMKFVRVDLRTTTEATP